MFKIKRKNRFTISLFFYLYSFLGISQIIGENGVPVDKNDKIFENTTFNLGNKNYSVSQNLIIESTQISRKTTKLDSISYYLILNKDENHYTLLKFYDKLKGTPVDLVQARILNSLFIDFYLKPDVFRLDNYLTCIEDKCYSFSGFNLEVFNSKLERDTILTLPKGKSKEAHVFGIGLDIYKNRYLFLGMNYIDRDKEMYFQRIFVLDNKTLSFIHKQDFYSNYATFGEIAIVDDFLYLKQIEKNSQNICYLKYKITL